MSYSPDSIKGGYIGDYIGDYYSKGVIKGDIRSLDCSSNGMRVRGLQLRASNMQCNNPDSAEVPTSGSFPKLAYLDIDRNISYSLCYGALKQVTSRFSLSASVPSFVRSCSISICVLLGDVRGCRWWRPRAPHGRGRGPASGDTDTI